MSISQRKIAVYVIVLLLAGTWFFSRSTYFRDFIHSSPSGTTEPHVLNLLECTDEDYHQGMLFLAPAKARIELEAVNEQLRLEPRRADLIQRKVHLSLVGDIPQAIETCRQILGKAPRNEFALSHLAAAYLMQNQFDSALVYAAQLEQFYPKPKSWNLIGTIFMRQNRRELAATWFHKTLEFDPTNQEALVGYEWASTKQAE